MLAWLAIPSILFFFALSVAVAISITRCFSRHVLDGMFWTSIKRSVVPGAVLILYLFHPMVTSAALSIFECNSFDKDTQLEYDTRRLLIDTSVQCDAPEHHRWVMAASGSIIFWS